jgi:hypothetical protein
VRRLVKETRFFELPSTIGEPVLGGSTIVMTITLGAYAHSVTVHPNSTSADSPEEDRIDKLYTAMVSSVRSLTGDDFIKGGIQTIFPGRPRTAF